MKKNWLVESARLLSISVIKQMDQQAKPVTIKAAIKYFSIAAFIVVIGALSADDVMLRAKWEAGDVCCAIFCDDQNIMLTVTARTCFAVWDCDHRLH